MNLLPDAPDRQKPATANGLGLEAAFTDIIAISRRRIAPDGKNLF
jgi:hypothetical protein